MKLPLSHSQIDELISFIEIPSFDQISINEIGYLINNIEKKANDNVIRMHMGIPGLEISSILVKEELNAITSKVNQQYPSTKGIPELKKEVSNFAKLFMNLNLQPKYCFPTNGAIFGFFLSLMVAGRCKKERDTILFIDPGFSVHKQTAKILGLKYKSFDIYKYRGEKLKDKLESYLKEGDIFGILYSNPNNPTWICLNDKELESIAHLANEYDVTVFEDLAYFGMDFRYDYSIPGKAPFQPTIASYTDNYIIYISCSKAFSYPGPRIGLMLVSDKIYESEHPDLKKYYNSSHFGYSLVDETIYSTTYGVAHSAQHALTGLLKKINSGEYNFIHTLKSYGEKAKRIKKLFLSNGFELVYKDENDDNIADGFYFTLSYKNYSGIELCKELLRYGISVTSLHLTGSLRKEAIRVCVSLVNDDDLEIIESRIQLFNKKNS